MESYFEEAVQTLLVDEGSAFVEDDNGRGPCKWGITLKTYQELYPQATRADIEALTPETAAAFYKLAFWDTYRLFMLVNAIVAAKMLNLVVNVGPIAIKWLQATCDVCEDMVIGSQTVAAANAMNAASLLAGIRARGEHYYRALVAKNPEKYAKDLPGWLARLAK